MTPADVAIPANDLPPLTDQQRWDNQLSGWQARRAGQPFEPDQWLWWRLGWLLRDEVEDALRNTLNPETVRT